MASGPGVSLQSGSPARELSNAGQQGANQTVADRIKTEDVTGVGRCCFFVLYIF